MKLPGLPEPAPPTRIDAWRVEPGDELEDGTRVISIHRNVAAGRSRDRRTVRIGVDDPTVSAIEVEHDHPVTVVRLLP